MRTAGVVVYMLMHPLAIVVLYILKSMSAQILMVCLSTALHPVVLRLSTECRRDALVLPTAAWVRSKSVHGPFVLTCQDCLAATAVFRRLSIVCFKGIQACKPEVGEYEKYRTLAELAFALHRSRRLVLSGVL